jgi:hypothetical protein
MSLMRRVYIRREGEAAERGARARARMSNHFSSSAVADRMQDELEIVVKRTRGQHSGNDVDGVEAATGTKEKGKGEL